MTERQALVLGATGGAGGEIALALHRHGWRVRAMGRDPHEGSKRYPQFGWTQGDALNGDQVMAAATGAQVIVHAVNPPGYRNWAGTVLPMIENTIAAAARANARIVLPGTLYNYGPETFPLIAEDVPQNPRTRKGKIRAALERRLENAARDGVRSLIVRAGDFFGPRATANSWFAQIVKPGRAVTAIAYPGAPNAGHAWAYLPDLAETIAALLDREDELACFERFHFAGHGFERGIDFAKGLQTVVGGNAPIRFFPWALVYALAPFVETLRETLEMRYLWKQDARLDNSKLVRFLHAEPRTPFHEALRLTLEAQGGLPAKSAHRSPSFA
jgi:nucleoside-diphosphate-sugar epimerase